MDETTGKLDIFTSELPDHNQELSVQDVRLEPESFEFFTNLPIEIRLRIWGYHLPKPRDIRLFAMGCGSPAWLKGDASGVRRRVAIIPPLLHVNKESRSEVLQHVDLICDNTKEGETIARFFCFDREHRYAYLAYKHSSGAPRHDLDFISVPAEMHFQRRSGGTLEMGKVETGDGKLVIWCFGTFGGDKRAVIPGVLNYFPSLKQLHLTFAKGEERASATYQLPHHSHRRRQYPNRLEFFRPQINIPTSIVRAPLTVDGDSSR